MKAPAEDACNQSVTSGTATQHSDTATTGLPRIMDDTRPPSYQPEKVAGLLVYSHMKQALQKKIATNVSIPCASMSCLRVRVGLLS